MNNIVDDVITDSIINCCNSFPNDEELNKFLNLYKSDKRFYDYIQKNLLINKIDYLYLLRLLNDYDSTSIVDDYDTIVVTTTRWI